MADPGTQQRRRIIRTNLVTGWDGASVISKAVPSNEGLAQHQVYVGTMDGPPSSGIVNVSVRPAKSGFYVPIGSIDLASFTSGQLVFPAVIDAVQLTPAPNAASGTYEAGLLSVSDDFTASHDQSDVDRRRFGMKMFPAWSGSGTMSLECKDQSGFTQHQFAVAGGVGTVSLYGRPVDASSWVNINYGTEAIDASGAMVIFPGMYDAFMVMPNGTVTGTILAQMISVGEEMFFSPLNGGSSSGAYYGLSNLDGGVADTIYSPATSPIDGGLA